MPNNPIINIILFIAACIVFPPLALIGGLFPFWEYLIRPMLRFQRPTYSLKKHFFPIFKVFALLLDQMANALAGALLNKLMLVKENGEIHPHCYKYGKPYDTISEVTGVNEERGLLTPMGIWFTKMLSFFLDKGHSINSINDDRSYPGHGTKDIKPYNQVKREYGPGLKYTLYFLAVVAVSFLLPIYVI